jgi:hypothetical protein
MPTIARPAPTDYAPYYGTYIDQVPEADVLALLARQIDDTVTLLRAVPRARWTHRYAPGKWSVSEVVGHLADTERIFAYRALRFARNDPTPLPGFDENQYVPPANFDARSLTDLADDLRTVRMASLALFRGLDDAALARRGTANKVEITVRAIPWIIAGHERHHVKVLKERYLQEGQ